VLFCSEIKLTSVQPGILNYLQKIYRDNIMIKCSMLNLIFKNGGPIFYGGVSAWGESSEMEGLTVSIVLTRKLTSSAFKGNIKLYELGELTIVGFLFYGVKLCFPCLSSTLIQ
jgi:hypothetical protein